MLIRIFSPTECGLIRDADLKKCGLNRMTTVYGGRWWLPSSPGRGESCESRVARGLF